MHEERMKSIGWHVYRIDAHNHPTGTQSPSSTTRIGGAV